MSEKNKASDALQPKSRSAQADFAETESFPPLQAGEGVPAKRAGVRSTPADIADCYTFTRFLGRGTQGSVYAAERKSDGLPVAIKVLQINSIQNWKEYELFWREAETLQSLDIPGVATFYEAIEKLDEEQPHAYLVQQLIRGKTLADTIKSGVRFSIQNVFSLAIQIIDILENLHHHDPAIIHRDIKPSNILYNEQFHEVYLIDFGAVAHPQKRDGGSTVAGTFGYMPPEQIFGNIAIQSDFYALGATMLHMLTGIFPGEISAQVYQIDIPAILREKAPDASPNMAALLASMLSADIDKRPPTAAQLCKSLDHVLAYPKDGIWQKISEKFAAMDNNFHRMMRVETIGNADNNPRKERWRRIKKFVAHPLWKTTKVTIQYSYIKQNNSEANAQENSIKEHVIEYTFEAHKRTWKGTAEISKIQINCPAPCLVRYDRLFPNNNMLFAIE